jgi:hypothetical protein
MNQKTTITAVVLATIMAASTVLMALPFESAEASRGGDARAGRGGDAESEGGDARVIQRGGDAETGDFKADGDTNEGNFAEGGAADGEATGGEGGAATGGAGGIATGGDDASTDIGE